MRLVGAGRGQRIHAGHWDATMSLFKAQEQHNATSHPRTVLGQLLYLVGKGSDLIVLPTVVLSLELWEGNRVRVLQLIIRKTFDSLSQLLSRLKGQLWWKQGKIEALFLCPFIFLDPFPPPPIYYLWYYHAQSLYPADLLASKLGISWHCTTGRILQV